MRCYRAPVQSVADLKDPEEDVVEFKIQSRSCERSVMCLVGVLHGVDGWSLPDVRRSRGPSPMSAGEDGVGSAGSGEKDVNGRW